MPDFNTPLLGTLTSVDANLLQQIFSAILKEMARMNTEIEDLKKKGQR